MSSKKRQGTDLPTSSTLDSPTILSQLVTSPPPSHAPHTVMSHKVVIASTSTDLLMMLLLCLVNLFHLEFWMLKLLKS